MHLGYAWKTGITEPYTHDVLWLCLDDFSLTSVDAEQEEQSLSPYNYRLL